MFIHKGQFDDLEMTDVEYQINAFDKENPKEMSKGAEIFTLDKQVRKMPRPLCVDSGAAKSVLPSKWLPEYEAKESAASKAGVFYVAANGQKLPDKGEKRINVITDEGKKRTMNFAVADVTKALGSVGEMCAAGHRVVFDDSKEGGSYIENLKNGEKILMKKDNGVYVVDLWVAPPTQETRGSIKNDSTFSRQGQ